MQYIVSQILGIVVFIFVFASMQTKSIKAVMLCQIGCNGLGMISYVLLDGFSGSSIYMVALIQSLIFFVIRKCEKKEPRWLQPIFVIAYIGCSALAFKGWIDIIPMVAAVTCALGISQKKPTNYRIIMVLNGVVWMIYDILMGAYTMLGSHVLTVVAALLGIIRLDILKKKES